jgi:tetratricopeptide (TPR) repeat protein
MRAAWQGLKSGDLRGAWRHCQTLLSAPEVAAEAFDVSSRVALGLGQASLANDLAARAVALDAQNASFIAQQCFCLLALREYDKAVARADVLAAMPRSRGIEHDNLGNVYSQLGEHAAAIGCFREAIVCEPTRSHHWFNLGLSLQASGDLKEAEVAFDRAIELDSSEAEPWLHRSRLRKQLPQNNHVTQLNEAIDRAAPDRWRQEMTLRYALAKELEDLEEFDRSFAELEIASGLRRGHMHHDPDADLAVMEAIKRVYDASYLDGGVGHDNREPIFIVGLPRTGTTLVERILGSHSAVYAAGELNNFAECLSAQVAPLKPSDRMDFIAKAAQVDSVTLGREYVQSTRPQTGHSPRFIDKLPLNFLYCGLIQRALPHARIIHLQRDPMDTCFAIYKTLFKQAYPFSYDLQELAQYYLGYRSLMAHWHALMPGQVLQVNYETLVSDLENQSRRLLAFCELPWEDACLEFHRSDAPSMTASLAQVRQPVYTSSVGKWRLYERHLDTLRDALIAGGVDIPVAASG